MKQNSTIVIVPSTAVETMQLGGLDGITALTMGLDEQRTIQQADKVLTSSNGSLLVLVAKG